MERQLPDDPLAFIQASVQGGRLYWTYHVNMRLRLMCNQSALTGLQHTSGGSAEA
jgi:hypothetical protein